MRVRVTQKGFYLQLRYKGEIMEIPDKVFSKNWMERLDAPRAEAAVLPVQPVMAAASTTVSAVAPVPVLVVPDSPAPAVKRPPGRPRKVV